MGASNSTSVQALAQATDVAAPTVAASTSRSGTQLGYGSDVRKQKFGPMFAFPCATVNQVLNWHKLACAPAVLLLMLYFQNFSLPAVLYLVMHGTYSVMWLVKYLCFPPKNFEVAPDPPGAVGCVVLFCIVGVYWVTPAILCAHVRELPVWIIALALTSYNAGIFLHYVGDAVLHLTLLHRGPGLIKDGLFARTRNPGYLGEVLIYVGFALLAFPCVTPWVVNSMFWLTLFRDNMNKKDASISRHPGWEEYKARSGQFFPKIDMVKDVKALFGVEDVAVADEKKTS